MMAFESPLADMALRILLADIPLAVTLLSLRRARRSISYNSYIYLAVALVSGAIAALTFPQIIFAPAPDPLMLLLAGATLPLWMAGLALAAAIRKSPLYRCRPDKARYSGFRHGMCRDDLTDGNESDGSQNMMPRFVSRRNLPRFISSRSAATLEGVH